MLLRVFTVEFPMGSDPLAVLTSAQKMASFVCVASLLPLMTGLYFVVLMSDSESLHTTSTKLIAAIIAAVCTRPALGACDRLFRFSANQEASRLTKSQSRNDMLYAGAALSRGLDIADLQALLYLLCYTYYANLTMLYLLRYTYFAILTMRYLPCDTYHAILTMRYLRDELHLPDLR
jgi:hypothetical protein